MTNFTFPTDVDCLHCEGVLMANGEFATDAFDALQCPKCGAEYGVAVDVRLLDDDEQTVETIERIMADETPIEVIVDIRSAWMLVVGLQLAARHPAISEEQKLYFGAVGRQFAEAITTLHPDAAALLEPGWEPGELDEPAGGIPGGALWQAYFDQFPAQDPQYSGQTLGFDDSEHTGMAAHDFEFGTCCGCGKTGADVRNVMQLQFEAPTPNKGWGCFVCHLPMDGAIAVLCDSCLDQGIESIRFVCDGYPKDNQRIDIDTFAKVPFKHVMSVHQALN